MVRPWGYRNSRSMGRCRRGGIAGQLLQTPFPPDGPNTPAPPTSSASYSGTAVRSGDDIAESVIPVPGLRPELRSAGGRLVRASNIDEKLEDVLEAVRSRPWLAALIR